MTKRRSHTRSIQDHAARRFRTVALLILIPVLAAGMTAYYAFGGGLMQAFANRGNSRLTTDGWESAQAALDSSKPAYGTKFGYYQLQQGQDLAWAAQHFSVSLASLQQLNPGQAVWGTTIMIPPVQHALAPFPATASNIAGITVTETQGIVYVTNPFTNAEAFVTIPQLMQLTQANGAITQLGPKEFLVNKPLYVRDNIRVDITSDTVSDLYLRSSKDFDVTTLTFQNSEALFKGVSVSTLDPSTGKPDADYTDGRSFVRAYENARMDVLDSTMSYMGMTLDQIRDPAVSAKVPFVSQGGVYGVAWRIGTGTFGSNIATGWVQHSTFEHNYIGAFTFGASGMMWQNNLFTANKIYGLDPHDDSNNATIEYNRFIANGKHGFIVSKRCDYNVIKDNISVDNALHGFMLHDDSNYNIFEDNISIGNYDSFVIYDSNYDTVTGNRSYDPRGSHVRINEPSADNYVTDNSFYGGKKGVYLYGGVNGVDISGNSFFNVTELLTTRKANAVLYSSNTSNGVGYQLGNSDRVVFGVNTVDRKLGFDIRPVQTIDASKLAGTSLTAASATAMKQ